MGGNLGVPTTIEMAQRRHQEQPISLGTCMCRVYELLMRVIFPSEGVFIFAFWLSVPISRQLLMAKKPSWLGSVLKGGLCAKAPPRHLKADCGSFDSTIALGFLLKARGSRFPSHIRRTTSLYLLPAQQAVETSGVARWGTGSSMSRSAPMRCIALTNLGKGIRPIGLRNYRILRTPFAMIRYVHINFASQRRFS
jgi:hypothetical protein